MLHVYYWTVVATFQPSPSKNIFSRERLVVFPAHGPDFHEVSNNHIIAEMGQEVGTLYLRSGPPCTPLLASYAAAAEQRLRLDPPHPCQGSSVVNKRVRPHMELLERMREYNDPAAARLACNPHRHCQVFRSYRSLNGAMLHNPQRKAAGIYGGVYAALHSR